MNFAVVKTKDVKQVPFDPHFDKIKEEIIECEESKIDQCTNLPIKTDEDYVREGEYLHNFLINISKEERNVSDVKGTDLNVDISDVKQEVFEFVQPKTESELLPFLTTHCDLPTLKHECTDLPSYLDEAETSTHFSKKRKCLYSVQKIPDRLEKKNFNAEFGSCVTCYYCGQFFLNQSQFLSHFFDLHFVKKVPKICKRKFGKNEHCRCKHCLHMLRYRPTSNITVHPNERNLKNHLKIRAVEKPFKCDICSKLFSVKSNLRRHLKVHSGEKSFNCEICSKQFFRTDLLKQHLKIHTGEKSFRCEICAKQFTQKSHLKIHFRIHTGEKPFECEICAKRFSLKSALKMHLKVHTQEKHFNCEMCSKKFSIKGNLVKHLQIHTGVKRPFKCSICLKLFRSKGQLEDHLRIHTGEKPFKCEICSKQFIQKGILTRHLRIHTRKQH